MIKVHALFFLDNEDQVKAISYIALLNFCVKVANVFDEFFKI